MEKKFVCRMMRDGIRFAPDLSHLPKSHTLKVAHVFCMRETDSGRIVMKQAIRKKIAFVGGDPRQLTAARVIRSTDFETALFGFRAKHGISSNPAVDSFCWSDAWNLPADLETDLALAGERCASLKEAIAGCSAVVLPLPASGDGVHVSMPLAGGETLSLTEVAERMREEGNK